MRRPSRILTLSVSLAALLGPGCAADSTEVGLGLTDARADLTAEGEVSVTGSSTVEPISVRVSEAFRAQSDAVDITVEGPGTGDGFQRFCAGSADVTGASRPIKDEELQSCAESGVEVIELRVALDGIVVITSPDNEVDCLSFADLYALVGPESKGIDQWDAAEALAAELGSDRSLPRQNLVIVGPGEESGTYDSFVSLVISDTAEARVEEGHLTEASAESLRPDYAASANDNAIVSSVGGDVGGLGWVGFAFADQSSGVVPVPIAAEPSGRCIGPTAATVRDGTYPVSRSLYIYVSARAAERDAVRAFVDFYLDGLDDFVAAADYVTLDADSESATRQRWEARTVGPADAP